MLRPKSKPPLDIYTCMVNSLEIFPTSLSSADFFLKHSFKNKIRVSNSLDPDQARHSVGPDLDTNCFSTVFSRQH